MVADDAQLHFGPGRTRTPPRLVAREAYAGTRHVVARQEGAGTDSGAAGIEIVGGRALEAGTDHVDAAGRVGQRRVRRVSFDQRRVRVLGVHIFDAAGVGAIAA